MVGHGVRTAKGGKSGEVKSLFIRQEIGKKRKSCPLYVGGKVSAPLILYGGFVFAYTFPTRWNRERTGIKRAYYFNPFFMNSWVLDFS